MRPRTLTPTNEGPLVTTWLSHLACQDCRTGTLEYSRRRVYGGLSETETRCVNCGRIRFLTDAPDERETRQRREPPAGTDDGSRDNLATATIMRKSDPASSRNAAGQTARSCSG